MADSGLILLLAMTLNVVAAFDPMTATLRKTISVPFPENGTDDMEIKCLAVTENNKLLIGIELSFEMYAKIKVVNLNDLNDITDMPMERTQIPRDFALLGDGLVAVSFMYYYDTMLLDVSGDVPVVRKTIPMPRRYVDTAVAEGTGDDLVIAGWTSQYYGYVDVINRNGDVIRNVIQNWERVAPDHVLRNGTDLFITVTDLNSHLPLYRVDLNTGNFLPNIGTLELSSFFLHDFESGGMDSRGNLYFGVIGRSCFTDSHPGSYACFLVIAPDGRVRVLLHGVYDEVLPIAVTSTPTGIIVAWEIDMFKVAVEAYDFV